MMRVPLPRSFEFGRVDCASRPGRARRRSKKGMALGRSYRPRLFGRDKPTPPNIALTFYGNFGVQLSQLRGRSLRKQRVVVNLFQAVRFGVCRYHGENFKMPMIICG